MTSAAIRWMLIVLVHLDPRALAVGPADDAPVRLAVVVGVQLLQEHAALRQVLGAVHPAIPVFVVLPAWEWLASFGGSSAAKKLVSTKITGGR